MLPLWLWPWAQGGSHAMATIFNPCTPPASPAFLRNLLLEGSKWGKGSSPPASRSLCWALGEAAAPSPCPRAQPTRTETPGAARGSGSLGPAR